MSKDTTGLWHFYARRRLARGSTDGINLHLRRLDQHQSFEIEIPRGAG
jgi:hypothetical protein